MGKKLVHLCICVLGRYWLISTWASKIVDIRLLLFNLDEPWRLGESGKYYIEYCVIKSSLQEIIENQKFCTQQFELKVYRGDNECKQIRSWKFRRALTLRNSPLYNCWLRPSQSNVLEPNDWSSSTSIETIFSTLTNNNHLLRTDFVCIHSHPCTISAQITECKIFDPNKLSVTL